MLRDPDSKNLDWTTAITAKGINAKVLTAGTINTGKISIMYNNEPYFRWDAFGITAYHFNSDNPGGYLYGLDTKRGVRFDRFGIYGYSGKDGAIWHPDTLQEVKDNSAFALTWDGLFLNLGQGTYTKGFDAELNQEIDLQQKWHSTKTKIGYAGKYLYNTWVNGLPSYNRNLTSPTFAKIFSVADGEGNEQLVIYDNGTLVANDIKFTGSVEWVPEASPARSVYGPIALMDYKPNNNWYYTDIPEVDPGESRPKKERWHKTKGNDDVLYCHTDTAGAVWDGPFLITGRSIQNTIVQYATRTEIQQNPSEISDWDNAYPSNVEPGTFVYIKTQDQYNDGSYSNPRYSVSSYGKDGNSVSILGSYDSIEELKEAHPTGNMGDGYLINGELWVWSKTDEDWINVGSIKGPPGPSGTSPYTIELDNDSATIGATYDGGIDNDVLQLVSEIQVTVYNGKTPITDKCSYTWTSQGGTLDSDVGDANWFTAMSADADAATATVTVYLNGALIGSKTFTITKNKAGTPGENAVTYQLVVTPNSWNGNDGSLEPEVKVYKYDGTSITEANSNDYTLTYKQTDDTKEWPWEEGYILDSTTEFYLKVNDKTVDSETVTCVHDGKSGQKGDSVAAIRIFADADFGQAPSLPTDGATELGDWEEKEITLDSNSPKRYVYSSTGTKKTTYNNDGTPKQTTYHGFTTPELWSAYLNDSVNTQSYATLLKLTNNDKSQGLFYDNKGQLYVNASYINTGILTIAAPKSNKVLFSADVHNGSVTIAGWFVGASSIKTGRLGSENSVWLVRGGSTTKAAIGGSKLIAGWSLGIGSNFGVTEAGIMYATGAQISGTITAESGEIAGWEIKPKYLIKKGPKKENKQYGVAINLEPYITGYDTNVLVIGDITNDSNWSTAAFRVTKTGEVHARAGTIAGWGITDKYFGKVHTDGFGMGFNSDAIAKSDPQIVIAMGNIGGLDDTNYSNKWKNARFKLTNNGKLTATDVDITGNITASGGKIGCWNINEDDGDLYTGNPFTDDQGTGIGNGKIRVASSRGEFHVYDESADFDFALLSGNNGIGADTSGGTMRGNWTFKDDKGNSITMEQLISGIKAALMLDT